MSWLVKDKIETTGDFQLDYVLKRFYKRELDLGFSVTRMDYQTFKVCSFMFNRFPLYTATSLSLHGTPGYESTLFLAIIHEAKTIYVYIDTEN